MVANLVSSDIDSVAAAFLEGFKLILMQHCQKLKASFNYMDEKVKIAARVSNSSQKFAIDMNCGGIKDFHLGLSNRIGKRLP